MTAKALAVLRGKNNIHLKILAVILVTFGIFAFAKYAQGNIYVQSFFERINSLGIWAPVLFCLAYIFMSGIFLPSLVFKIFAGTLFGITTGIIVISIASTISSLFKFLLARYFFKERITRKIATKKFAQRLNHIIREDGWRMLVLLRNIPLISSMFLNYLCAVTPMRTWDFVTASFVGRLPSTFLYVYLGYLVGYTAGIDTTNPTRMTMEKILLWVGLLASIALAYYTIYVSKKVIEEKLPDME